VTDWRALNAPLFAALGLQQIVLFLLLGLIVLVSTFHVAATLVVLLRERRRELGALAAQGLEPRRIRRVFQIYGLLLGLAGGALGLGLGVAVAWIFDAFELVRFDADVAEIYFIRAVPFHLRWGDLAAIALFAGGVTAVACWLPSRRAASLPPADA